MPFERKLHARVNVWVPTGFATTMGIGHGSLELRTQASTYYITRFGDNFSTAAEGNRATGFTHIQDRRTEICGGSTPRQSRAGGSI